MSSQFLGRDEFLGVGIFQALANRELEPSEVARLRHIGQIEEARSFIRYAEFHRGAELLEDVVTAAPDDEPSAGSLVAIAHSVFGQGLESWGDPEQAAREFELALEIFRVAHPDFATDPSIWTRVGSRTVCDMAMALSGTGEHELAERLIRESRQYGPATPEATRRLATYAARSGQVAEAIALVDEALTVLPADPECWYALATARSTALAAPGGAALTADQAGKGGVVAAYEQAARGSLARLAYAQSLEALVALRELEPTRLDVAVALAEVLRRTDAAERALVVAEEAVALAPDSAAARMARALALWEVDRPEDAARDAQRAAELDADYGGARALLSMLAANQGDLGSAETLARASLVIAPLNRPALVVLARVLSATGRLDEAEAVVADGLSRWPQDGFLLLARSEIAVDRNDAGAVIETLEQLKDLEGLADESVALLARAYLQLDRYDEAITLLTDARSVWPDADEFRHLYAAAQVWSALVSDEDDDAALQASVEAGAQVDPDSPDVVYGRAQLMLKEISEESLESALRLLESSVKAHPDHLSSIQSIILILRELGRPAEALDWMDRATDAGIDRGQRAVLTAECLRDLGRDDEALATVTGVVAAEGNVGVELLQLRAELLGNALRWKETIKDRQELVRRDDSADRHFELAEAYRMAGLAKRAREEAARALERDPHHLGARATRAALLTDEGNAKEARDVFLEILEEAPDNEFALRYAIQLALTIEEATAFADRLEAVTGQLDARTELAYAHLRLGSPGPALELLEALLADHPDMLALLIGASYAAAALSRYDTSAAYARAAVEQVPDNARALQALGDAELAAGNVKEALAHLSDAYAIDRDDVDLAARYADALVANDDPKGSLDVLDDAIHRRPKSAVAWRSLGGALSQLGYYEEAIDCLSRAMELGDVDAWTRGVMGWSRLHADPAHPEVALDVLMEAIDQVKPDLWLLKDVANAKHALAPGSGDDEYERVIDEVKRRGRGDPQLSSLAGWANFRLRRLPQAGRLMLGASTGPRSAVSARFDLGLVGLCAGRLDQAQRHYESALEIQRDQHRLRWRGPLRVALVDLDLACVDWPEISDATATHAIRQLLSERLAEVPDLPPLRSLTLVQSAADHRAVAAVHPG